MSGSESPTTPYPRHYLAARLKKEGSTDLFIHMDAPPSPSAYSNVTPLILFNERLEKCLQERKVTSFVQSNQRRFKAKTSETTHTQSKPNSRKMLIIEEPTMQLLDPSAEAQSKLKKQPSRYLSRQEKDSANKMPHLNHMSRKLSKSLGRDKALTEEEKERGNRLINHLLSKTPLQNRLQQYDTPKHMHKQSTPTHNGITKMDDSAYFYAPLLKLIKEKAAIINSTPHPPPINTHFSRRAEPSSTSQEKRRPTYPTKALDLVRKSRKEEEFGPWAELQEDGL